MVQTMREFSAKWERDVVSLWKKSAAKSARTHLRHYILPTLGDQRLGKVQIPEVQALVSGMIRDGRGLHYVKNVVQTIRSILTTAEDWQAIKAKPDLAKIRYPEAGQPKPGRWYSVQQVQAILEASPQPWRTLWITAALTGMRCGEILGLPWEAVDFQARIIRVQRAWTCGEMGSVKSKASRRTIPLPEVLAEALTFHRLHQTGPNPDGLVFPNQIGRPLRADHVLKRQLRPILKGLGIPPAGFHAFRHAMATALVSSGADPKVAQSQLGHSDLSTTLSLYAHLVPDHQRKAVDGVAEIFTAGSSRRVI